MNKTRKLEWIICQWYTLFVDWIPIETILMKISSNIYLYFRFNSTLQFTIFHRKINQFTNNWKNSVSKSNQNMDRNSRTCNCFWQIIDSTFDISVVIKIRKNDDKMQHKIKSQLNILPHIHSIETATYIDIHLFSNHT